MFEPQRRLFLVFALIVIWRVVLLVFTAQPIPANDAFFFDGAMVNWLHHGPYFNPSLSEVFPISGRQVYCAYPPLYQVVLLGWMSLFGASVLSAMAMHLALQVAGGCLALTIIRKFFPPTANYALVGLLFLGITFGDRPEDLAHVLGLASLYFVARNLTAPGNWRTGLWIFLCLLSALYTSIIAAALYFGVGFVACAIDWLKSRRFLLFMPYVGAAVGFTLITAGIAHFTPLYWHGFLENARQTPVGNGFHLPQPSEVIKLIRTAPVFLLFVVSLPIFLPRLKQIPLEPWLCLTGGVLVMGGILLAFDMTLLAANYVMYVLLIQILLAAGWIQLSHLLFPQKKAFVSAVTLACALLLSIRAVGMSTWGVWCAAHNSYAQTHATLKTELEPFTQTNTPVIISSPFLYSALEFGVRHPIHFDWYYDRANTNRDMDLQSLTTLRPAKFILTQFDYYRGFTEVERKLRQHPDWVDVRVRNDAVVKPPDAIPSLQRVVQHVSWAPVVVDLQWKR